MAAKIVAFTQKGNKFFATVDGGPSFYVGSKVIYKNPQSGMESWGLINLSTAGPLYDPADHRPQDGIWADFVYPICLCESQASFQCLNTYDRAFFTFGFLQFAAHVPDGDFVTYFHELLKLPEATEYFPDLKLDNGRIVKMVDGNVIPLESAASTEGLMDYFNPSPEEVEDTEVIQAAKMVHWVQNDPKHREVQVKVGIAEFKKKMAVYARWYPVLDGNTPPICLMVADIHHQGRAKVAVVQAALQSDDPLSALLKIGEPTYHDRLVTLRREIKALTDDGTFGNLKYDAGQNDFR